jgi:hypothetical protein
MAHKPRLEGYGALLIKKPLNPATRLEPVTIGDIVFYDGATGTPSDERVIHLECQRI